PVGRGGRVQNLRLGGRTKPPLKAGRRSRDEGLTKLRSSGSMLTWSLIPLELIGRVRLIERRHGLKPDWGKPTVRNFRGDAGNVSHGRIRNPPHNRKSEGRKLPTYSCARLYSTRPNKK